MVNHLPIIVLVVALLLDFLLGDPLWMPHPIVAMGKTIAWLERMANKGHSRRLKGAIVVLLLVFGTYALFVSLIHIVGIFSVWALLLFEVFFCFSALAGTTLIRECKKVFEALEESLLAGRKQVGFLVGRDTAELSEEEVKTATLETLAENLSDGVVAPLFWYAVGGIPLMLTYKMINTLDSMIAYKTEKYHAFGWFAAHVDDIANWIPARITAFVMVLITGSVRGWRFIFKYGKAHSSPNAGYPESALAGILDVQFGGGHFYHGEWIEKPVIGDNKRAIVPYDMVKALRINRLVEIFVAVWVVIFLYLVSFIGQL